MVSRSRGRSWAVVHQPVPLPASLYAEAIDWLVARLSKQHGVVAVYAMGAIGQPGISDVDLLVVFEDEVSYAADPLDGLPEKFSPLFTHGLFGTSRAFFADVIRYGHYPNLALLHGEPLEMHSPLDPDETRAIHAQVALEYLVTNFISRAVEVAYGVVNARGLLLSAHAIRFDLELLGIRAGRLYELVTQIGALRQTWFASGQSGAVLVPWLDDFFAELERSLAELCITHGYYLPIERPVRYARHIRLRRGDAVRTSRRGMRLPASILQANRNLVRVQHRLNRFEFEIPGLRRPQSEEVVRRARRLREATAYNRDRLPKLTIPAPRLAALTSESP
jgi:hypothetical protein